MADLNVRIIILEPPSWLSASLADEDGKFSLDIDTGTTVAITRQIDEANTVGVMRQDVVRNFSLPPTEKNAALIGAVGDPTVFNFIHEEAINVQISVGLYVLPEQKIVVRGTGDKPYEVEAFGEANQWISGLAELPINTLPFGTTPPYNWEYVLEVHQQRYFYQDGELPIFFPIANYGRRLVSSRVAVEDVRIWHSALYILRESFCAIGWKLNCPILETELGRRIWTYILAEDYATLSVATNKGFNAILTLDSPMAPFAFNTTAGTILFDNDSVPPAYDSGGFYDPLTGHYTGSNVVADFFCSVQVDGIVTPGEEAGGVLLFMQRRNLVTMASYNIAGEAFAVDTGLHTFELTAKDVFLSPDEVVFVYLYHADFPGAIKQYNSKFWNVPKATVIAEGDLINTAAIIDPKLKALDYLKGVAHLLNLKHETDSTNKVVSFYPEDGGEFYTSGLQESFFRGNAEAKIWTDKVKCETLDIDITLTKNKREVLLEFKPDGGDGYVSSLDLPEPPHSYTRSYGANFKEGTQKYANPFFAPTYNAFDWDIAYIDPGAVAPQSAPYIPFLLKSAIGDDGVLPVATTKIVPRVLLSFEPQRMEIPVWGENTSPKLGDISVYEPTFPTPVHQLAYYAPSGQIFPKGFTGDRQFGLGYDLLDEEALVYGTGDYNDDLPSGYDLWYKEPLKRLYSVVPLGFLINLSFEDFVNFSHRDKVYIKYFSPILGDIGFYARVSMLTDYVLNKAIVTPVLLVPNSNRLDLSCCNCEVIVVFIGFNAPTLDFNAQIVGECGEVVSFNWTLTNHNPATNIGIVGSNSLQIIKISGNAPINVMSFTVEVTVETECGTEVSSYRYN